MNGKIVVKRYSIAFRFSNSSFCSYHAIFNIVKILYRKEHFKRYVFWVHTIIIFTAFKTQRNVGFSSTYLVCTSSMPLARLFSFCFNLFTVLCLLFLTFWILLYLRSLNYMRDVQYLLSLIYKTILFFNIAALHLKTLIWPKL